ncbi:hypothetical protein ACFVJI_20260 [Streptomyces sp. NPDC127584]|uniref:hypothetical protein n=1 Tax=Streptomyces sp. NPDC127584 TaxID=3345403 RepID=UPI00362B2FD5
MSVDQASWEAAVRHLFEDAHPYDATGPRRLTLRASSSCCPLPFADLAGESRPAGP